MKIALCQLSPVAGNIDYNCERIIAELQKASAGGADLAIFTELCVTGYPPRDLLDYPDFVIKALLGLGRIGQACRDLQLPAIVGIIVPNDEKGKKALFNAAAFLSLDNDEPVFIRKKLLPTYDVFDEHRYFEEAPFDECPPLVEVTDKAGNTLKLGVSICEDIWNDNEFWRDERLYPVDPLDCLVKSGAEAIVNISASPFVLGKPLRRVEMLTHIARRRKLPVIFVNQAGGNDQVVFDGGSCVVLPDGNIPAAAGWFTENQVIWDVDITANLPGLGEMLRPVSEPVTSILEALKLGLKDYMARTGFEQVLVGNSGGIDSAVVLAVAALALGADKVISVTMPGHFTSEGTYDDAGELARRLGIRHMALPIADVHAAFTNLLATPESAVTRTLFDGDAAQANRIAEENVQARIRGNILMYISNAISSPRTLLLSTGNKSELAVGYCTLYGDMCGGLALISDLPKMAVYRVARKLNEIMGGVIPQTIIDREPSAELAPGQKDSDSLPPYPVLDEIVRLFVEEHKSPDTISATGVAEDAVVRRVVRMIELAEYKRAQAAPGIKITSKAFGIGRRMPIARSKPA